jgi:hypothetical protein
MKKIGVYFKNDYYKEDFEFERQNVSYKEQKLEIWEVELVEFEDGHLLITYKTDEYVSGESTIYLDMKYIDSYYIF